MGVRFIEKPRDLSGFRAVILPGSKNTRADLAWLGETGWTERLRGYADGGGHILGICGGYQMMGRRIHDPEGIEGAPGASDGLGLLPVETILKAPKTTTLTRFNWSKCRGSGYEIHMGQTERQGGAALFNVQERNGNQCRDEDGCVSADGRFMGTYMHGLFDSPGITRRWLGSIGLEEIRVSRTHGLMARNRAYDLLAEHFERHIDLARLGRHIPAIAAALAARPEDGAETGTASQ